jgi:hypothetical protein
LTDSSQEIALRNDAHDLIVSHDDDAANTMLLEQLGNI